jgi:hypothetical protein
VDEAVDPSSLLFSSISTSFFSYLMAAEAAALCFYRNFHSNYCLKDRLTRRSDKLRLVNFTTRLFTIVFDQSSAIITNLKLFEYF